LCRSWQSVGDPHVGEKVNQLKPRIFSPDEFEEWLKVSLGFGKQASGGRRGIF